MSDTRLQSPDGRYAVQVDAWEAFNSHWVESPRIVEVATGNVVFVFKDDRWSLDHSRWLGLDVVEFALRKYPGNHEPSEVVAWIDCEHRVAGGENAPGVPFEAFEVALDAMLTWR